MKMDGSYININEGKDKYIGKMNMEDIVSSQAII